MILASAERTFYRSKSRQLGDSIFLSHRWVLNLFPLCEDHLKCGSYYETTCSCPVLVLDITQSCDVQSSTQMGKYQDPDLAVRSFIYIAGLGTTAVRDS